MAQEYCWEVQIPLLRRKEQHAVQPSARRPFGQINNKTPSSSQAPPTARSDVRVWGALLREMAEMLTSVGVRQYDSKEFRLGPLTARCRNGVLYGANLQNMPTPLCAKKVACGGSEDARKLVDRGSREIILGHLASQNALLQRRPRVCGSLGFAISEEGDIWILTSAVSGCDLKEYVGSPLFWARTPKQSCEKERGVLLRYVMPERQRWRLCLEVATALTELSEMQVAHCSVRPGNLMVGDGDRLLLYDFGQARRLSEDRARPTDRVEVRRDAYDAPEMRESGVPNKHSDTYSAAVVMLQVFTGSAYEGRAREPAPAADQEGAEDRQQALSDMAEGNKELHEALVGMHRDAGTLRDLQRLCKTHPKLAVLLAKCLAANPSDRPRPRLVRDRLAELAPALRLDKTHTQSGENSGLSSLREDSPGSKGSA